MKLSKLEEMLILANWFYNLGKPIISDQKYNEAFIQLKEQQPDSVVVKKTWSEFEKPVELLEAYNLTEKSNAIEEELKSNRVDDQLFFLPMENMQLRKEKYKECLSYFDRFIPKSIETIDDVDVSKQWLNTFLKDYGSIKLNFSTKADGYNIALIYYKGYFIYAHTRGRSGNHLDCTIAMSKVVPLKIKTDIEYLRITCEAVMDKQSLVELREMDKSREWKSERNSIRTLLISELGDDYHKRIIPLAFKVEGLDFESIDDKFRWLMIQGFKIVDNETTEITNHTELLEAVRRISEKDLIYKTDGCVVTVALTEQYRQYETSGKYDFAMRAYRMYSWKSNYYCSLITDVDFDFSTKRITLGLNIVPRRMAHGGHAQRLTCNNLRRLKDNGLKRGSLVIFNVESDSYPTFLEDESRVVNLALDNDIPLPDYLVIPVRDFLDYMEEMKAKKESEDNQKRELQIDSNAMEVDN